ncbi:MAG: tetratricopeptide repeat protein [candidate division WOR-3 bacterium]
MEKKQRVRYVYLVIPILFSLIIYAQGLSGGFVWDDRSLILQNPIVQNPEKLLQSFKTSLTIFGEDYGYYRPLSIISFAIDHLIWQKNAFGFHLTNLLLHILAVLCLIYFLHQLFDFTKAIIASILFSAFAVHIENVIFISGRMDILATLFMLLSLICYLTAKHQSVFRLILSYVLILVALLSKEIALVFPLVFALVVIQKFSRETWKNHFKQGGLLIGAGFVTYFLLKLILLNNVINTPGTNIPFWSRFLNIPRLIIFYLQVIVFPYNLNARHYNFLSDRMQVGMVIFCSILLLMIILAIVRIRKKWQITFGWLWFLIGLLPVLNIFPLYGITVAERFLYFPSIGIAILLAGLLPEGLFSFKSIGGRNLLLALILFMIFANNMVFAFMRVPVWHDEEIFFRTMVIQNPESPLAHHNLGHFYYRQGNWASAEEEYKKAIKINPYFPAPHASLGDIYFRTGQYHEAVREYSRYLQLFPDAPNRTATIARIKELQELLHNANNE